MLKFPKIDQEGSLKKILSDKEKEAERARWYKRYKDVLRILPKLELKQHLIRLQLKAIPKVDSNVIEINQLRRQLYNNRKGPNGLRSLNKTISWYYRHC